MIPDAHAAHHTRISVVLAWPVPFAVCYSRMSILFQERHIENLNSATPRDRKSALLHDGDVLALSRVDSVQHDAT